MPSPLKQINNEIFKKISVGLKDDPDKLAKYVELFKEWLNSENHLPQVETCLIENFIRLCKYDLEKAKSKFEGYVIQKNGFNHLKHECKIEKVHFTKDDISKTIIIAPDLNPDLTRTLYFCGSPNNEFYDTHSRQKYIIDLSEWFLHQGLNVGTGIVSIVDLECFTVQLVTKLDFTLERRFMNLTINYLPAIIKRIHFVNVPASAKPLFVLLKSICSEKIRKRMIIHDDIKDLQKYFPIETLPIEFQGTSGKSLDDLAKNWEKFYIDEIEKEYKPLQLCGEVPKHKKDLDPTSGFGVNGSFRQLQLD